MLFYLPLLQFMQLIGGEIIVIAILMEKIKYLYTVIAPAGFWLRGQNPRRHPRIPRVYDTYKEFQNVRK